MQNRPSAKQGRTPNFFGVLIILSCHRRDFRIRFTWHADSSWSIHYFQRTDYLVVIIHIHAGLSSSLSATRVSARDNGQDIGFAVIYDFHGLSPIFLDLTCSVNGDYMRRFAINITKTGLCTFRGGPTISSFDWYGRSPRTLSTAVRFANTLLTSILGNSPRAIIAQGMGGKNNSLMGSTPGMAAQSIALKLRAYLWTRWNNFFNFATTLSDTLIHVPHGGLLSSPAFLIPLKQIYHDPCLPQLLPPKGTVVPRHVSRCGTPMPETAIHKQGDLCFEKQISDYPALCESIISPLQPLPAWIVTLQTRQNQFHFM